jgi:hypothetical protein
MASLRLYQPPEEPRYTPTYSEGAVRPSGDAGNPPGLVRLPTLSRVQTVPTRNARKTNEEPSTRTDQPYVSRGPRPSRTDR